MMKKIKQIQKQIVAVVNLRRKALGTTCLVTRPELTAKKVQPLCFVCARVICVISWIISKRRNGQLSDLQPERWESGAV